MLFTNPYIKTISEWSEGEKIEWRMREHKGSKGNWHWIERRFSNDIFRFIRVLDSSESNELKRRKLNV